MIVRCQASPLPLPPRAPMLSISSTKTMIGPSSACLRHALKSALSDRMTVSPIVDACQSL